MVAVAIASSVSCTISGSPHILGVAAARTYSHRGVITATPKDTWLGFMRWTRTLGLLKRRKNVGEPDTSVLDQHCRSAKLSNGRPASCHKLAQGSRLT